MGQEEKTTLSQEGIKSSCLGTKCKSFSVDSSGNDAPVTCSRTLFSDRISYHSSIAYPADTTLLFLWSGTVTNTATREMLQHSLRSLSEGGHWLLKRMVYSCFPDRSLADMPSPLFTGSKRVRTD